MAVFTWEVITDDVGFTLALNFKRGTRCGKQLLPLQLLELDAKFSQLDVTCEFNELILVISDVHGTRALLLSKDS